MDLDHARGLAADAGDTDWGSAFPRKKASRASPHAALPLYPSRVFYVYVLPRKRLRLTRLSR